MVVSSKHISGWTKAICLLEVLAELVGNELAKRYYYYHVSLRKCLAAPILIACLKL